MKKAYLVKNIFLSALFISGFLFFANSALASTITQLQVDNRNDFILEPAKQEVDLDPGTSDTRSISITSRISTPTTFEVTTEDIIGSEDPTKPVILLGGDKSPYSLKDYLHPDTDQFTLNFGQKITIPVSIDLPKTAAPGGFYAAVIVSNAPSKIASSTGQASAITISRIASLFFVKVNGPVNQSGQLTDFKIKESGPIYQNGNLTFEIYFKNDGTVHLVPYGTIDIKNMWGQIVSTIPVDAYFSLPQSLRYREVAWSDPAALGHYTATLHLNRGYGSTTDERTIGFWVIPYKIILITLLIIIILVGLIYFFVRNFEFKRKK